VRFTHYGIDQTHRICCSSVGSPARKGFNTCCGAIQFMNRGFQIVLCAAAPDTPETAEEMKTAVEAAKAQRPGVIWINEWWIKLHRELYSHAAVFVCPFDYDRSASSILRQWRANRGGCSAVGGIKEVVVDGETGFPGSTRTKRRKGSFERQPRKISREISPSASIS